MAGKVFISHSEADADLAAQVSEFLAKYVDGLEVTESCLPGREPTGGDDSVASLKQGLTSAGVVIGLVTPGSLGSSAVTFALGAGWALGKSLVLLFDSESTSADLFLPMGHADTVVLSGDGLLELAESCANRLSLETSPGEGVYAMLRAMFPGWQPPKPSEPPAAEEPEPPAAPAAQPAAPAAATEAQGSGSTQPVWPVDADGEPRAPTPAARPAAPAPGHPPRPSYPAIPVVAPAEPAAAAVPAAAAAPEPATAPAAPSAPAPAAPSHPPRPSHAPVAVTAAGPSPAPATTGGELPSAITSFEAGRAFSECVFHRDQGGPFASELDTNFGAFLATLGGNWTQLRELEDLDVWMETADNCLESLSGDAVRVRHWYEVGYQLATMLNLAEEVADADPEALQEVWQGAWEALSESALEVGFPAGVIQELRGSLDNLIGPEEQRDYTNVGRIREDVRTRASAG